MTVSQFPRAHAQAGFTLIELIVVIVILGILSAMALPKFSDLASDARRASLKAARGSLETVSVMTHARSILSGSLNAPVTLEGATVAMVQGYPSSAATTATAAGLSSEEWTITVNGRDLHVTPKGATTASACRATYSEATSTGGVITPARTAITDTRC